MKKQQLRRLPQAARAQGTEAGPEALRMMIPMRGFPFRVKSFEKHRMPKDNTNISFQRISEAPGKSGWPPGRVAAWTPRRLATSLPCPEGTKHVNMPLP